MHKLVIALAVFLVVVGRPAAASEEKDVMVPVEQFIEGFNKSDGKMAEAACAEEALIIDDFPPHVWHGAARIGSRIMRLTSKRTA